MKLSEVKVWSSAIAASLALHAAVLFYVPCFVDEPPEPRAMKVSLVAQKSSCGADGAGHEAMRTEMPVRERPVRQTEVRRAPPPAKKPAARPLRQRKEPKAAKAPAVSQAPPAPTMSAQSGGASSAPAGSEGISGGASQADGAGSTVDVSTLAVLKMVTPDYPAFSRKRGEEGTVKIIVTIENGVVASAEIEVSSGYARLDASAMRAVKQWRFGEQLCARVRVPFAFKLK